MNLINEQEKKYWLAATAFTKMTPQRFQNIREAFVNLETAWQAPESDWRNIGWPEKFTAEFIAYRQKTNPENEWQKLLANELKIVTLLDKDYPPLLKQIFAPPPVLYARGQLNNQTEFTLAVVGTRMISVYGREVTQDLVGQLARRGLVIVSGLALGVDAMAHQVTLENGGRTVAVLGSGVDWQNIYPSSNRYLARKIVEEGGALVSEFPIGTLPLKHHFPQRNRIISGLSRGVLVIEASETSGALITVKHALEQNREVFAVPGPIHSLTAQGVNTCLKQGATPVTTAEDVLEALNLVQAAEYTANRKIIGETPEEKKLLVLLDKNPLHINDLVRASGLNMSTVNGTLALMEMKGLVKNIGGMKYILINN